MPITDWPTHERPRERLLAHGAHSLSDAELLAVFLRVGIRGMTAVDLAQHSLRHFGGLPGLFGAGLDAFSRLPGLGTAKYAQLQAVLELARRTLRAELHGAPLFRSPGNVTEYLRLHLGHLPHEVFVVLFLDTQHRLIAQEEMFRGTLTQTAVYPREVVKRALAHNAASVVFAHNHPSGSTLPSAADRALTEQLVRALSIVDVRVLDHFVVTASETWSFAEHGEL